MGVPLQLKGVLRSSFRFTAIQYEGVLRFFKYVKTGNDSKRKKWFNIISLKEIQSLKRQNIYSLIENIFFFLGICFGIYF